MNIIFENSGEIDIRTVATFGCSVKESENPIGFFGTGLKYALAVLLRTGHQIRLQSGLSEFRVEERKETIRGKEFGFVVLSGEECVPLGFTTELGKTWKPWMAYRELFCNAKDERDGRTFPSAGSFLAEAGKTRIIVDGQGIREAHDKKDDFLLTGTPIFKLGTLEVYHHPGKSFFYNGIKVMDLPHPGIYTYNQTARIDLTEDRTAKEPHSVIYEIARSILTHADRQMLERVLIADENQMEHHLDYHGWSIEPSPEFFPTVNSLQRDHLIKINPTALRLWREKGQGFITPRRIKLTAVQTATLERAISFCEKSGFLLRDEYPILAVENLGDSEVLAIADRRGKQILLTERLFQQGGTKLVARALMEEYLHLKFGFDDCSRQMQNFLFEKTISLAEELTGSPL